MLLFKCTCGKACCAQDSEAGQKVVCGHCGEEIPVPSASDADCLLLFRRGDPDNGQALTSTEFQHLLNRGELFSYDLVSKDGEWVPLGKVYELPPPPAIEMDGSIAEIALDFQDLPAVEGFAKVPKKKKRTVKFDTPEIRTTKASAPGQRPVNLKKRILTGVKTIIILTVLFFGGIRLGRIVNFVLKRVSNVMVVNTFDVPCRFKINGYEWQELPKNTHMTQPDVYVAFSCKKKILFMESTLNPLTGMPDKAKEGAPGIALDPPSMRIPIKPGFDTVVNPGGRGIFGVYDFSNLSGLSLSSPELKSLSTELAQAKPPVSVLKVTQQIQNLVRDTYKESRKDLFFTSKDYNFESLGIIRNQDLSIPKDKTDAPAKAAEKPLLSLVYPTVRTLSFRNGSVAFDPDTEETERSIILVSREFKPKPGYSVTGAAPRLQIRYEKSFLVLQLSALQGNVKGLQNAVYKAQWSYLARMDKAGKWTWLWTAKYQKPGVGKKAPEDKILTIDQAGKEAYPNGK